MEPHPDEGPLIERSRNVTAASSTVTPSRTVGYKTLRDDEIRLVNFGAQGGEPLLMHAQLDDLPEYTAISYCWGDENCLHQFEVNGQILIVTSSLMIVFRQLQRRGFEGRVWADAVCINQGDDGEKATQIPLMGAIYRGASTVFAWLGAGRPGNAVSLEFLTRIASLFDAQGRTEESKTVEPGKFSRIVKEAGLPLKESRVWDDLSSMLNASWFERLWTFQEAILARHLEVGYGQAIVPWKLLQDVQGNLIAILFDERYDRKSSLPANDLNKFDRLDFYRVSFGREKLRMGDLLEEAIPRSSSKAQDKVFALYNLMSPAFRNLMPVDLSMDAHHAFIRATKAVLSLEPQSLFVLALARRNSPHPKHPKLPSWVPNLNYHNSYQPLTTYHGYDAGQVSGQPCSPHISFVDGEDSLDVEGFHLDVVEHVVNEKLRFDIFRGRGLYSPNALYQVFEWTQECIYVVCRATNTPEDQVLQRVSRVLVCDRPKTHAGNPLERCSDSAAEYLRGTMELWREPEKDASWVRSEMILYQAALIEMAESNWSFFITKTGYLGMGPADLSIGDRIVVLYGAEVPFAVRKRPSGSNFELLGECYVDGIMEGQAVDAHKASGKSDQLFTID